MSNSGAGSGIQMNVGELTMLASDVNELAEALSTMQQYASGDQLTAAHFGAVQTAADTGSAFLAAVKALATSIGTAQTFAASAHTALLQAAKATSTTDEQSAEAVMNAGEGA